MATNPLLPAQIDPTAYLSLFELLPIPVLFVDEQTTAILDANPAACAFYGCPRAELTSKTIFDVSVLTPAEIRQRMSQIAAGEVSHMFVRDRLANGEIRDVEVTLGRYHAAERLINIAVINDVSEQVRAEKKLQESEEHYRLLFAHMGEGFSLYEVINDEAGNAVDARILMANTAYETHTGLKPEDVIGRTVMEVMPQTYLSQLEPYLNVARTGKPVSLEYFSTAFQRYFRSKTFCPQPGQFATIVEDITERKRAETALQESEALFSSIFHASQVGVNIINLTTRQAVDCNYAFLQLTGYSREELIGHTAAELNLFVNPDEYRQWAEALQVNDMIQNVPTAIRRKSGEIRHVMLSLAAFESRGETMVVSVSTDITELKRAEAALLLAQTELEQRVEKRTAELRYSEEKFSKAFYEAPVARALVRATDAAIVDVNNYFTELFEHDREQVLGHTALELGLYPAPADRAEMARILLDEHGNLKNYEFSLVLRSGRRLHLLISTTTVNLADGNYQMIAFADITKRKRGEEKLAETNLALEKALRVKDEFMAAISHELRTPLTGILGMAESLQLPHYGELSEKQRKAIRLIETNGNRLLDMINMLLEYSRLQSGDLTMQPNPCNLAEICQAALQTIQPLADQKHQQTHLRIEPDPLPLTTDRQLTLQLLKYLLENASKFTPESGEFGIEAFANQEENLVRLSVWDKGVGIPEQDIPRLFQPFVQLDSRLARKYEGAGLGLILVRQIAELLGGHVIVESVVGQGSRFLVTLPWIR